MDPLEDFIHKNKEQLKEPLLRKEQLWETIKLDILPVKKTTVRKLYWRKWAAAAGILLVVGLGLFWMNNADTSNQLANNKPVEVLEIDAHYQKLINVRIVQVKNSTTLSENQKKEIIDYLQNLEKESQKLETELEKNVNNVQIIQAIIKNYRERLEIMENLLDRSTEQNSNKHERNISI